MTKDQIIAMAVKAGFTPQECLSWGAEIQRLSQLVAAQAADEEREECARVPEKMRPAGGRAWSEEQAACFNALTDCAEAIRERKSP